MFVIGPEIECKFFPGYGNGKHVEIGKLGDKLTCVKKVKKLQKTANAATFRRSDHTCYAVFNATSRNGPGNEYETCIFGGNIVYYFKTRPHVVFK